MRIAYVVTRADAVGGATIHVLEMAQAMLRRGHEVAVFVGGVGEARDRLAESGASVHSLRFLRRAIHPVSDLRALAELTAALREFRPALVSTHTAKAGWIGRAACARLGIPVLYTPHGLPVGRRMRGLGSALFGLAERVAAPWADAIVCVSESERCVALARHLATRLGKGTGQEPMIRFGSSDVANAVGSSLRARLRVSEAGERKGEMVRYHRFKEREFLLYPKQTWTDLLRAREDPNYEIDDIF